MPEKIEKLKEMMKLLNEGLTREEFVSSFKKVLEIVAKMEQKNRETLDTLQKTYSTLIGKTDNEKSAAIKELKDEAKKSLTELLKISQEKLWQKDKIIEEILKKVPPIPPFPEIKPITTEEIINKINGVLEVKDIVGLQEKIDELKRIRATGGGFSMGGLINTTRYADLSSQCNGSNKIFTVPRHRKIVILTGTDFPIIYRPTIDYTTANLTLTITGACVAPSSGATLIFQYIK